jgi:hypothetical protein
MTAQTRSANTATNDQSLPMLLVAALFFVIGIGALVIFVSNITSTLSLRLEAEDFGTTLLRFLNDYGIIVPLILIGIGVFMIRLGMGLFRHDFRSAAWSRQILLWLGVAAAVIALQGIASIIGGRVSPSDGLPLLIAMLVAAAVCAAGYVWLGNNLLLYDFMVNLVETIILLVL